MIKYLLISILNLTFVITALAFQKTREIEMPDSFNKSDWLSFLSSSDYQLIQLQLSNNKSNENQQWLKLLHIVDLTKPKISQVQGENFFLSGKKSFNSYSEMITTLFAISQWNQKKYSDSTEDPICLFPARIKFLKNQFQLLDSFYRQPNCAFLDRYLQVLDTDRVSFVFSSYYTNNPGSAFGHTFFKFSKRKNQSHQTDLLDHGIGYAAKVHIDSAILYPFLGIFGGFNGEFSNLPYYYKVREYNDFESRDLWEYELDLTPEEVEYLVLHLWEMGQTHFTYYFLSQNCAYHMLTALEAATSRLEFISKTKPWMLPVDSIKLINQQNQLIKQVKFRPSVRKQFYQKFENLNKKAQTDFIDFVKNKTNINLNEYNELEKVALLDTQIDYLDMKYPKILVENDSPEALLKTNILKQRAQVDQISSKVNYVTPLDQAPHLGHESNQYALFYETSKVESSALIDFRFSLHGFLDPDQGYLPNSQLEFGRIRFRLSDKQFDLQEFVFIDLMNISPITPVENYLSWRTRIATIKNSTNNQHELDSYYQMGYSQQFNRSIVYGMLGGGAKENSFEVHANMGWLFSFDKLKFNLDFRDLYFLNSKESNLEIQINTRWRLTAQTQLAVNYMRYRNQDKYQLGLLRFF